MFLIQVLLFYMFLWCHEEVFMLSFGHFMDITCFACEGKKVWWLFYFWNTSSVLKWFIDIFNKNDCSFIQLDIREFYPSINEDILTNAIQFAKLHTRIDDKDLCLIMHCRKFWLLFGNEAWKKKSAESCFDVIMGSFDGAEICKLIGLYIQSNLENILPKTNFGLYWDDGLILLRNLNGQ